MRLPRVLIATFTPLCLALAACSSLPKFQESNDPKKPGYSARELDGRDHLEITLNLPDQDPASTFVSNYAYRATAEECGKRGFLYYDMGPTPVSGSTYEAFCFPTSIRKSLAITFKQDIRDSAPRFIVENLNNKTLTKLKVGDEVRAIDKAPLVSMNQAKSTVFKAAKAKRPFLPLEITREGKTLTVDEPIADFDMGAVFGPNDLEALRNKVR